MNRVVREHYPVARLPEDLRREFSGLSKVKITLEAESLPNRDEAGHAEGGQFSRFRHLTRADFKTMDEVVEHVRRLRDEWDDRGRILHPDQ